MSAKKRISMPNVVIYVMFSLFLQGCSGFETFAYIAAITIKEPINSFKMIIPKIEKTQDILVEIKDTPDGKRGEARIFVEGEAMVWIILEDAENMLRFDEEYELSYGDVEKKGEDYMYMKRVKVNKEYEFFHEKVEKEGDGYVNQKLTNRDFKWIAEGGENRFVYLGYLCEIKNEMLTEHVFRFKFNKTLEEGMKNGKFKLRVTTRN